MFAGDTALIQACQNTILKLSFEITIDWGASDRTYGIPAASVSSGVQTDQHQGADTHA